MKAFSIRDLEDFACSLYRDPVTRQPLPIERLQMIPYFYTLTFAALAQNGQATQQLNINADSDFILIGLKMRANIGAVQTEATSSVPFIRLLLTDSGTNQPFMSNPIDAAALCEQPYLPSERTFPYPRVIAGRSNITVQATNYSPAGGETYSFDLVFEGMSVRVYGN